MLKGVIFDLDGTLVTLEHDFRKTRQLAIAKLTEHGVPKNLLSIKDFLETNKARAVNYLRSQDNSESVILQILAEVEEVVRQQDRRAAEKTKPAKGVHSVLEVLRKRRLRLAVFTYNNRETTRQLLERHGLSKFFDVVVARDDTPRPKPDPNHLEATLEKLSLTPSETVVVTDGTADAKACGVLGVFCVGVAGGHAQPEELIAAGANLVIETLEQLPEMIAMSGTFDRCAGSM